MLWTHQIQSLACRDVLKLYGEGSRHWRQQPSWTKKNARSLSWSSGSERNWSKERTLTSGSQHQKNCQEPFRSSANCNFWLHDLNSHRKLASSVARPSSTPNEQSACSQNDKSLETTCRHKPRTQKGNYENPKSILGAMLCNSHHLSACCREGRMITMDSTCGNSWKRLWTPATNSHVHAFITQRAFPTEVFFPEGWTSKVLHGSTDWLAKLLNPLHF